MADVPEHGKNDQRPSRPAPFPAPPRREGGRVSPGQAIVLSLLSWPDPEAPRLLKPFLVLLAAGLWLSAVLLAGRFSPMPGEWPVLPAGVVLLTCGFVGGSVIAILTSLAFFFLLHYGLAAPNLSEFIREMVDSGYTRRDLVMFVFMAWISGVPHWKRSFSWIFTVVWGLVVVFGPVLFVVACLYAFYGYLPETIKQKAVNREMLLAWGVTVIAAAALAKILYLIKDVLRRVWR